MNEHTKFALSSDDRRKLVAEAFGTFALVFTGTGAIIINDISGGVITHPGIAITFGLIVLAMICAIGDVSGCHLNPAVSTAFCAIGQFERRLLIPYVLSQFCGALVASLTLKLLFPEHHTLGSTIPSGSHMQSFVLELLLTMLLMFVVLCVSNHRNEKSVLAGIVVGSVIALEAMFAGPICGASMNPARSLAPALVSFNLFCLWIYLAAPVLGALAAIPLFRSIYQ